MTHADMHVITEDLAVNLRPFQFNNVDRFFSLDRRVTDRKQQILASLLPATSSVDYINTNLTCERSNKLSSKSVLSNKNFNRSYYPSFLATWL
jgi:hypothetical protein